jgi:NAD(P)-dependent dehydrogenase (short-subunit alcohol dehydrogenase family)
VACRTQAKADAAAQSTGAAGAFECDLSSLESVQRFLDAWGGKSIDVLCLNAGVANNYASKTPRCVVAGWLAGWLVD